MKNLTINRKNLIEHVHIIFFVLCLLYISNQNRMLFHDISELIFSLCFLFILIKVIRGKPDILNDNKSSIIAAIVFKILSGLLFMLHNNPYEILSSVGHLFNILAYYCILKVMFNEIVINPYNSLFKQLNNKVDELDNINKKLEEANYKVKNIEKLNEKFINLIPDGILIVRDKKIESANNRFLSMFEIDDIKQLENMYFTEIIDSSYHEIFKSRVNNMDRNVLEKPQQYEFVWGNKKMWVETTSLIESDESGEYIISAIRNIEDRKKAEEVEQLLKLKRQEEKMKNDFIANISHELRTPINVIYSALQVEENYLKKDNTNEHVIKYNKIIKQNCLRLMRLINNIIDTTRIETSFFKPNYRVENIVSVVEDISMSIVEYVKSKKINLIFDTEIEEAYVSCDLDLIERIMLNLLSNAVKYGREGGNIEVNIYKTSENSISILVKDDGIGIPDDMKQKIFDRFLKVDSSLSRKAEGSGIGLSLVKQLVEIHKGTITCHSKLNVGTEFKITLPIVEDYEEHSYDCDKNVSYSQNAIKSTEIEFSDIYD